MIWIGSAAYDIGVEFSRTTGQITHHISPDVDAERDLIIADLTKAGSVSELRWVDGFHKELQGRNGGGDLWRTDGRLAVVVLRPLAVSARNSTPEKKEGRGSRPFAFTGTRVQLVGCRPVPRRPTHLSPRQPIPNPSKGNSVR